MTGSCMCLAMLGLWACIAFANKAQTHRNRQLVQSVGLVLTRRLPGAEVVGVHADEQEQLQTHTQSEAK